jgi:hypothetical protein
LHNRKNKNYRVINTLIAFVASFEQSSIFVASVLMTSYCVQVMKQLLLFCAGLLSLLIVSCEGSSEPISPGSDTSPHVMNPSGLLFDGNTKISVPDADDLYLGGGSYTIQAWVKVNRLTDYYQEILVKGTQLPDIDYDAGISMNNRFYFLANKVGVYLEDTSVIIPGRYYHYAVVSDMVAQTVTLYINGMPKVSTALAGTPTKVANRLLIGGHTESLPQQQNWNGIIYNLSIWKIAKTPSQVKESMYQRLKGDEANLVACWFIDEGTGTAIKDVTGQHNGTVLGTPQWVAMPY